MVTILRDNKNRGANGIHERRASMRQQSADEKAFSIETVLSTEQAVRMWDWDRWEPIDEVLLASGRTIAESVPLLDSHRTETINRVLGHVENVRTEGSDTVGLMLFDASDSDAVKAFNKYRGNHATDVSVGYIVTGYMEVKPGETVTIEGRAFTAGVRRLRIATAWRLNELSCVARGADSKAKVRSADEPGVSMSQVSDDELAQLQLQRSAGTLIESRLESTNEPSVVINITNGQIETPAERSAGNTSNAGENGKNERTSDMTTTTKPESTGVDETEILKRGIQMERKRQADIKAIGDGVRAETLTKAMDDADCTVDKARELFLTDLQEQRKVKPAGSDAPGMILGNKERDCNEMSLAMALVARMHDKPVEAVGHRINFNSHTGTTKFERAGYNNKARQEEFHRNLERADKYRGISTLDICREALRMSGIEAPFDRHELVQRALSTPALSAIYTNASSAVLISEMEGYDDPTLGWTKEIDVPNFTENALVRVDGGKLKKRQKGEKAAHSTISATAEVVRAAHYANTLILDVIDLANDNIGAIKSAMDEYGFGVAELRPTLVYGFLATNAALKTDSIALFHADHNNLVGSGLALNAANLQTVAAKLGTQKDSAGNTLNLNSFYIVTGGYSFVADQLANSVEIRETAAANGTKNPFLRLGIGVASDYRLSGGYTDPATDIAVAGAPTLWYLAAKGGRYGVNVAFVDGMGRMPRLETKVLNAPGEFGLAITIDHSIGCGTSGYQGLQKAIG
jgi:hypothetical protein